MSISTTNPYIYKIYKIDKYTNVSLSTCKIRPEIPKLGLWSSVIEPKNQQKYSDWANYDNCCCGDSLDKVVKK